MSSSSRCGLAGASRVGEVRTRPARRASSSADPAGAVGVDEETAAAAARV